MNLIDVLASIEKKRVVAEHSSIYFVSADYPYFFFSRLLPRYAHILQMPFTTLDVSLDDSWRIHCATTFLGQQCFYWLIGFDALDAAKARQVQSFIFSYEGPHIIGACGSKLFTSEKTDEAVPVVSCDAPVTLQVWSALCTSGLFSVDDSIKNTRWVDGMTLDQASTILAYAESAGSMGLQVYDAWKERIHPSTASLFTLGQHFFSKNKKLLSAWRETAELYPPEFWLVFWGELLWQATLHVSSMKFPKESVDVAQAKKITYRLPYSFLQRDWQRYTVRELSAAHNFLYGVDYAFKHGNRNQEYGFEIFLLKFLRDDFARA